MEELAAELEAGLRTAQGFFLATLILPAAVFYGIDPSSDRKFPATISWQIRRGTPKILHHITWLAGWGWVLDTLRRIGEARVWLIFAVIMVSVGVVAVVLAPVDGSKRQDAVHYAASAAYIVLHIPWMSRWRIPHLPYQLGFYASLLLFALTEAALQQHRQRHGARLESELGLKRERRFNSRGHRAWHSTELAQRLDELAISCAHSKGSSDVFRRLIARQWWLELAEMVLENAVFLFFVCGMPNGAQRDYTLQR